MRSILLNTGGYSYTDCLNSLPLKYRQNGSKSLLQWFNSWRYKFGVLLGNLPFLSKFPDALAQIFSTLGVLAGMPGDARDTVLENTLITNHSSKIAVLYLLILNNHINPNLAVIINMLVLFIPNFPIHVPTTSQILIPATTIIPNLISIPTNPHSNITVLIPTIIPHHQILSQEEMFPLLPVMLTNIHHPFLLHPNLNLFPLPIQLLFLILSHNNHNQTDQHLSPEPAGQLEEFNGSNSALFTEVSSTPLNCFIDEDIVIHGVVNGIVTPNIIDSGAKCFLVSVDFVTETLSPVSHISIHGISQIPHSVPVYEMTVELPTMSGVCRLAVEPKLPMNTVLLGTDFGNENILALLQSVETEPQPVLTVTRAMQSQDNLATHVTEALHASEGGNQLSFDSISNFIPILLILSF